MDAPPTEESEGWFTETKFYFAYGTLIFIFDVTGNYRAGETETNDCDINLWRCPPIPFEHDYVEREHRFYFSNQKCIQCLEKVGTDMEEATSPGSEFSTIERHQVAGTNSPCSCKEAQYEMTLTRFSALSSTERTSDFGLWLRDRVVKDDFKGMQATYEECEGEQNGDY